MSDSITAFPARTNQVHQKPTQIQYDKTGQGVIELPQGRQQQASFNITILESAAAIIGVKDDPLALVFSTAIDNINQNLAAEFGDRAIQKTADAGLDVGPDATADRIVNLTTSFYGAFRAQHAGQDESIVLTSFMQTISRGIENGFGEARDILEGLEVLEGDIADNINQTFSLVQEKLAAFQAMMEDMNELPQTQAGTGNPPDGSN